MKNILFGFLLIITSISHGMANEEFAQKKVSFNRIHQIAKQGYKSIFDSDLIFLLYPYSTKDEWIIQDIAQACINYASISDEFTKDTCQNFIKDIIGVEPPPQQPEQKPDPVLESTDGTFSLITTPDTESFTFTIGARGEYKIDCGDGSEITTIQNGEHTCDYTTNPGKHTITVTGKATSYAQKDNALDPSILEKLKENIPYDNVSTDPQEMNNMDLTVTVSRSKISGYDSENKTLPAIWFANNQNLAEISGSLGSVFSTLDGQQPSFNKTFANCTNLTTIPDGLFSGISGKLSEYMFDSTFIQCTGLTEIPAGLFRDMSGTAAPHIFYYTFDRCTGLTKLPSNLFSTISGSAENMFEGTFLYCSGLKTLPDNLFSSSNGTRTPTPNMFDHTFYGCKGLTDQTAIPAGLFSGIEGAPAENMFESTFDGCTNIKSIPAGLFSGIKDEPAKGMFQNTFRRTGLTEIPDGLFDGITGTPAVSMFEGTFSGCESLTSIPQTGLFKNIKDEPAEYMFYATFYNCSSLESIPTGLFSGINGKPAKGMFARTFSGCRSLTSIPTGLFDGITDAPAVSMFEGTFSGCTGLTEIKPGLFSGISGPPASMMFAETFYDCTGLTSIPADLFSGIEYAEIEAAEIEAAEIEYAGIYYAEDIEVAEIKAAEIEAAKPIKMFYNTFYECKNLKGTITSSFFGKDSPITKGYLEKNDTFFDTGIIFKQDIDDDKAVHVTTTADTDKFSFSINATGDYTIDCGDGSETTAIQNGEHTCEYTTPNTYTLRIFGQATKYNNTTEDPVPAISFTNNTNIAEISGSFGNIFPTLSDGKTPTFYQTFKGCTNLKSISNDLFSGISGNPSYGMFAETFSGCTSLESIPKGLFSGISGNPSIGMFTETFQGCTGLTDLPDQTAIPADLFSGIEGAPKEYMFYGTFYDCSSLESIPDGLFSGIHGAPAENMFSYTFMNCTNLKSIPADLFSGIEGASAEKMFYSTFSDCTNLEGEIKKSSFFGNIYNPQITEAYLYENYTFEKTQIKFQEQ